MRLPETVRLVHPTGDVLEDTRNIVRALDELAYDQLAPEVGTLLLSGSYTVNTPLVSGGNGKKLVIVRGIDSARIHYRGPRTTEPVLSFAGSTRHRVTVCSNLRIDAQLNARGVQFSGLVYQTLAENLYVYNSRQVGIHAENCDGSSLSNCMVEAFTGCGLVAPRWNAASLSSLRFGTQWGCWYAGEVPTSPRSQEVRNYEMLHGKAAAEERYKECYASDWPEELAESDRGTMLMRGNVQELSNLIFERCQPCEYPLLSWTPSSAKLSGMYCEANNVRCAPVVVSGQAPGTGYGTSCVRLEQARYGYGSQAEQLRPAFVQLRGNTSQVSVAGAALARFGAVVDATHGTHSGVSVERVKTIYPTLPQAQWIKTEQTPPTP